MAAIVRQRKVFYIPGYDPFPPRRYRELFRKESAAQAEISGYQMSMVPGKDKESFGWLATAVIDGNTTTAEIEVLLWSDIVRSSMNDSIISTYFQLWRTVAIYLGSGAIFRLVRLRKGPAIAALYPIVLLLVQLGLAIAAFFAVAAAVRAGLDLIFAGQFAAASQKMPMILGAAIGAASGLFAAVAVLRWFKSRDRWFYAYYLMHDYAFTSQFCGANPPQLEARMADFGARIRATLDGQWDEVLVVGHSSGAHLAVSVLADLIRAGLTDHGYELSFLSLGHVVPMASFLPKAQRLRGDLAFLSAREDVTWVDVTAPGDGCSFALCDPVSVTGVAPPNKRWPLVISAAFTQTLSKERWKELRWRFFRLHFQYLCAFDRPGDYDYFQITTGPMTLADRFRDRAASQSRIDVGSNSYQDVT